MDLENYVRSLPKAELHVHIEGTLEPEMMFALAQRNAVALPWTSVEATRAAYAFTDLQSFLDLYYAGAAALVTAQDFSALALAYFTRAHADIFLDRMAGVLSEAMPVLARIHGVGLDSSERDHPPAQFSRLFARCRELGLHVVAHAGEEGPPAYISEALDVLKAERIDHGVRADDDPALLARLAREQIPLTVCPLSNVKLCVFRTLAEHDLKKLLDAGLKVTINSDDPAYFGGYIASNYVETARALHLTHADLKRIARNSLEASFVDDKAREPWLARLDAIPG